MNAQNNKILPAEHLPLSKYVGLENKHLKQVSILPKYFRQVRLSVEMQT